MAQKGHLRSEGEVINPKSLGEVGESVCIMLDFRRDIKTVDVLNTASSNLWSDFVSKRGERPGSAATFEGVISAFLGGSARGRGHWFCHVRCIATICVGGVYCWAVSLCYSQFSSGYSRLFCAGSGRERVAGEDRRSSTRVRDLGEADDGGTSTSRIPLCPLPSLLHPSAHPRHGRR